MRILYLSSWFPYPPDNGSKLRVHYLIRALAREHEVKLISFAFGEAPLAAAGLPHPYDQAEVIARDPFQRGRLLLAARFFSPAPVVSYPIPEVTQRVRAAIANTSFDAVIASTQTMVWYALNAPTPGVRILEEHNSLTRWMWERYRQQSSALQRMRCALSWQKSRYYESWLFRRFALCVMVSEQDRNFILSQLPGYRGPVAVVSNGVDCEWNRPGLAPKTGRTLVFNGALTYSANFDAMQFFLAQVFPLIQEQAPDVELLITGSTAGVDLTKLALRNNVRFTGYVDDLRPVVGGADIVVVPIRQGGGTRLKILEAMALGTPVVSTTKGAEGLNVVDGEHVLLADAPAEFAAGVLAALRDPEVGRRLAVNARRLVEAQFDWNVLGQRFVGHVEAAARGPIKRDSRT